MPKTTVGSKINGKKKAKLIQKADGAGKNVNQILEGLIDEYLSDELEPEERANPNKFAPVLREIRELKERLDLYFRDYAVDITELRGEFEELKESSGLEAIGSLEGKADWFKTVGEGFGDEGEEDSVSVIDNLVLVKDRDFSQEEFEGYILPFFVKKFGYNADSWSEARSFLLDGGYNILGVCPYGSDDSDYFVGFYKSVVKDWEKIEGV